MSWSSKFCTAVLDLNGFKRINDTWGHAAGDHLLRQFGAEIQSLLRSTDRVGRWGGDEFVIVIESPIEEAARSLDRVLSGPSVSMNYERRTKQLRFP